MTQKLGKTNRTGEKSYYRNKNNKSPAYSVNTDETEINNNKPVRTPPQ